MVRMLNVARREACAFGDSGQHAGPDLVVIVKREDDIRPIGAGESSVRSRLSFNLPADAQEGGEYSPSLG